MVKGGKTVGYLYRSRGCADSEEIICTTKKGTHEGGLPKGFIIPIGALYVDSLREQVERLSREEGINVYVAKHCDNEDVLTHIVPSGIVNRFGLFFTKDTSMPDGDWCLDIAESKWMKMQRVPSFALEDVEKYL